jgi:hypothetical protein
MIMRVPRSWFRENRNFLSLWKFAAGPRVLLRIRRRGGKTAILASKLDFGLGLTSVRSRGAIIEAESQREEKPRTKQSLHGNFEHAPPNRRSERQFVADQPE